MPTEIRNSRLPEAEKKEEKEATEIKSRDPHLAGAESLITPPGPELVQHQRPHETRFVAPRHLGWAELMGHWASHMDFLLWK